MSNDIINIHSILDKAAKLLQDELKHDTPLLDSKLLLEAAMGCSYEDIKLKHKSINDEQLKTFWHFVERRIKHEPVAYIIEKKDFWRGTFFVNKNVLIPRPDTETIIEAVLSIYKDKNNTFRVCDLGTGSGCIIISLLMEYKNASGIGIDISADAIIIAKHNAHINNICERVEFFQQNWLEVDNGCFDVIVSNPPYIALNAMPYVQKSVALYEPEFALTDFGDGLQCYRDIAKKIRMCMKPTSIFLCEIGQGMEKDVISIFKACDMQCLGEYKDLSGITRCLCFC